MIRRAGPIPDNGKEGTALSVSDPEARLDRVKPALGERIPWGAKGVEVVMQQRAGQAVQVVDEAGAPVEDYTLFVLRGERKAVVAWALHLPACAIVLYWATAVCQIPSRGKLRPSIGAN